MKKAAIFILTIVCLAILFDVYLFLSGGTEATISHTLILWSYDYPPMTFLTGYLMGHLFWRMRDTIKTKGMGRRNE